MFTFSREDTCKFAGKEIVNNSANRFNCYSCDFDLCRDCGHEQVRRVGKQKKLLKESKLSGVQNAQPTTPLQPPKRGLVGTPQSPW